MDIKAFIAKRAAMIVGSKMLMPFILGGIALFAFAAVAAAIISAVTSPVQVVTELVTDFFFGDNNDDSNNVSDEDMAREQAFQKCVKIPESAISLTIASVPEGVDADLARAWIMYDLAHNNAAPSSPSANASESDSDVQTPPEQGDVVFTSIGEFAPWWRQHHTAEPAAAPELVPAALTAVDAVTDYDPYVNAGLAATVHLATSGRIDPTSDQVDSLYVQLIDRCSASLN